MSRNRGYRSRADMLAAVGCGMLAQNSAARPPAHPPSAPPVPAPPPPPPPPAGLTAADLETCRALGMDPLEMLAARTRSSPAAGGAEVCRQLGLDPREFEAHRLQDRIGTLERGAAAVNASGAGALVALASGGSIMLSAADLATCRALGLAPEAYAEQRARELGSTSR
jgi:hypothetical protein